MKKKVLALTLTAALALSSTTALAAQTTCTKTTNYDFSNLLKECSTKLNNSNVKYKVTVNGKTIDFNSAEFKDLLNKKLNKNKETTVETPETKDPAVTQPKDEDKPTVPDRTPAEDTDTKDTNTENNNTAVSSYEQKVVELVNVERQNAGLPALKLDASISNIARMKSKDMADNNYFAHQSPTYGSAGDMLTKFGIKWSAWGENIASGQKTPEAVVTAWMNSPGHKANILSSNYSKIGVGYVTNSNGTSYWTQMFTN